MPTVRENKQDVLIRGFNATIFTLISVAVLFALWHILPHEPFGHDESVYLLKARAWHEGTPAEEWEIYRPIAMSVYAWLIFFFDNSIVTMRMFGVFFGAIAAGLIFGFFRQLTNLWIALATTVVITTSTLFLEEAPLFRNDVPAAAMLIAVLWLLYIHYQSDGKSNSIYWAARLAALAFYTRYGVATTLAVIAASSCYIMLPRLLKRDSADFKRIWRTILIAAALFVPFFIVSKIIMGHFAGILEYAGSAAHPGAYIGEGLVQYIHWIPKEIGGFPISFAALIGAFATPILLAIPKVRKNHFALAWTGSIGLGSFLLTGLFTHADPRYVFFPLVLLSGTGIAVVYYALARLSQLAAVIAIIATIVITVYFGVGHYKDVSIFYDQRVVSPTSIAYANVFEAIRNDAAGRGCSIWLIEYLPKAAWDTKCSVYAITDPVKFRKDKAKHPENINYSVAYMKLSEPQIKEETSGQFNVALTEIYRSSQLPSGDLVIYRINDISTTTSSTTISTASSTTNQ